MDFNKLKWWEKPKIIKDLTPDEIEAIAEVQDLINETFGAAFETLASTRGEHWILTEAENNAIGGAFGAVLNKYIKILLLSRFKEELFFIIIAGSIVNKRLKIDKMLIEQQGDSGTGKKGMGKNDKSKESAPGDEKNDNN